MEYATALAQSALDRTSTGRGGKLQAEDVLFVVRKVSGPALLTQMSASQNVKVKMQVAGLKHRVGKFQNLPHGVLKELEAWAAVRSSAVNGTLQQGVLAEHLSCRLLLKLGSMMVGALRASRMSCRTPRSLLEGCSCCR